MVDEPTPDITILFADVCRSTDLFDTMGDQAALELIMTSLELAEQCARHHRGTVIGTIGDELMCTFDSADDALLVANQIHLLMQQSTRDLEHPMSMRIGVNTGSVVNIKQSVYGDAVNIAARLAAQAKANQSLVADSTILAMQSDIQEQLRLLGDINLQGKSGPIAVYELLPPGEEEEITEITSVNRLISRSFLMTARFRSRQYRFDPMLVRFVFGRNVKCDLVIDHPTISREHAEFQYRNGQFIFRDFSSNGSIVIQNARPRPVHRSSLELSGNGQIYLGRTVSQPDYCISFSCNSIGGNPIT